MKTLLFCMLTVFAPLVHSSEAPCKLPSPAPSDLCRSDIQLSSMNKVRLFSNYSLENVNSDISKLVIIIHGIDRNASGNFWSIMNRAFSREPQASRTLVVSPYFFTGVDRQTGFPYWDFFGWSGGYNSLDLSQISSFTVLDQLIAKVFEGKNFPNLKAVTLVGSSAGGQAVQRYAAGTELTDTYPGIHFRFMVASPSSYMYFRSERFVRSTDDFETPNNTLCEFDHFRYGLMYRNDYMNGKSESQLTKDYFERDVVYLVGELDDATSVPSQPIPNDPKAAAYLDVSCAAQYQGESRVDRARVYKAYIDRFHRTNTHPLHVISGVAHQLWLLYDPSVIDYLIK